MKKGREKGVDLFLKIIESGPFFFDPVFCLTPECGFQRVDVFLRFLEYREEVLD